MSDAEFDHEQATRWCALRCSSSRWLGGRFAQPHTLTTRLQAHLHLSAENDVPNTAFALPVTEHANLQLALDELAAAAPSFEVLGLPRTSATTAACPWPGWPPGTGTDPVSRAPARTSTSTSAATTAAGLRAGLVLTEHGDRPVAVLLYVSEQRGVPEVYLEVVAADATTLGQFVAGLPHTWMEANNVIHGKVMTFSFGRYGEFGMTFTNVEPVARAQVIIPDGDLVAIERHAIGISGQGDALVAAGQHGKSRSLAVRAAPERARRTRSPICSDR